MNVAAAAGQLTFSQLQAVQHAPPAEQTPPPPPPEIGGSAEADRLAVNADLANLAAHAVGESTQAPSTDAIFSIQASLGLVAATAGRSGASALSS